MQMLGEDDFDLREMTDENLEAAWDLWFDLAQDTNEFDPPYSHGVFVPIRWSKSRVESQPLNLNRWIFPVTVLGKDSTYTIERGRLYAAIVSRQYRISSWVSSSDFRRPSFNTT